MTPRKPHIAPKLLSLALLGLPLAAAAQRGTTTEDLPHRDKTIHWPAAFDPATAPLFSHKRAPHPRPLPPRLRPPHRRHRLAQLVRPHPGRPYRLARQTLQHGTLIRLKIFGTPITTRIDEFVPGSRLSWIPQALPEAQPTHYHTWHFLPEPTGCRVITEETGIGPNDVKLGPAGNTFMHRAHDLWLASLKWTSEP